MTHYPSRSATLISVKFSEISSARFNLVMLPIVYSLREPVSIDPNIQPKISPSVL